MCWYRIKHRHCLTIGARPTLPNAQKAPAPGVLCSDRFGVIVIIAASSAVIGWAAWLVPPQAEPSPLDNRVFGRQVESRMVKNLMRPPGGRMLRSTLVVEIQQSTLAFTKLELWEDFA